MDIITQSVTGTTYKTGSSKIAIPENEWLQIRYGTPEAPATELQVQCPEGKKWSVSLSIEIFEMLK
jgi:hypothetical protein